MPSVRQANMQGAAKLSRLWGECFVVRADLVGDAAVDAVEAHVHEERLARLDGVLALGGRRGLALGCGRQQRLLVAFLGRRRLRARPLRQPPQRQRLVALQETLPSCREAAPAISCMLVACCPGDEKAGGSAGNLTEYSC